MSTQPKNYENMKERTGFRNVLKEKYSYLHDYLNATESDKSAVSDDREELLLKSLYPLYKRFAEGK